MASDESPFPMPKMECRGCGKDPHEGYCYPLLDWTLVVLICFLGIGLFSALMLWMAS